MAPRARTPGRRVYRVSGASFASALAFPELTPIGRARPQTTLVVAARRVAPARPVWYHEWTDANGAVWTRLARVGAGHLLRFPRLADFAISRDQSRVRMWARPGTPVETLRHLFLNQVWPLVLAARGALVLHASAVETPAGAIAFLGATGLGKSTLAASFAASGAALVTDDCLRVEVGGGRPRAVPSHPSVRLWPATARRLADVPAAAGRVAHYTGKLRLPAATRLPFARRPVRLVKAYVLDPPSRARTGGAAAAITPLSGRDALAALIGHLYRLDVGHPDALSRDFGHLVALATRVPMARLRPTRGLARLHEVRQAILKDLGVRSEKPEG